LLCGSVLIRLSDSRLSVCPCRAEEQALRRRIAQLRAWREAGVQSVAAGMQFEMDKRRRVRSLST
jgi:hypothetical protein